MFHIFFCLNDNYAKFAAVMLYNIIHKLELKLSFKDILIKAKQGLLASYELSHTQRQEGFVFHLLSSKLSTLNTHKLRLLCEDLNQIYPCKLEIHSIDDAKYQNSFAFKGNFVANYILEFASFAPFHCEKALALDLDIFVNCDLRELFVLDLKDNVLAAASNHTHQNKWFNTGLVLFNVPLWRSLNLEAQSLTYIQKYKPKLPDQAALNVLCKDKTLFLPPHFNLYPHNDNEELGFFKDESFFNESLLSKDEFELLKTQAKIVHFLACAKPWHSEFTQGKISEFRKKWWENAFCTPHFKEELKNLAFFVWQEDMRHLFLHSAKQSKELKAYDLSLKSGRLGAKKIFKQGLTYKIGKEMMKVRGFFAYIIFIFKARKLIKEHKKQNELYKMMIKINPHLELPPLQSYADYDEALKLKRQLTYRLGKAFLKARKNAFKGGYLSFLKELKALKNEF